MDRVQKNNFNRLRVAFSIAYRRILDLPWRCSASGMYAGAKLGKIQELLQRASQDLTKGGGSCSNFSLFT